MWIGVCDYTTGIGIANARFNYPYANYGNGWYDVLVSSYQNLYCEAPNYNSVWVNTNGYDSFRIYLVKKVASGTTKK